MGISHISCREIIYQLWGNHVIMKYEIKLYREMHVSFTSKTHVDVIFVGIKRNQYSP